MLKGSPDKYLKELLTNRVELLRGLLVVELCVHNSGKQAKASYCGTACRRLQAKQQEGIATAVALSGAV